LLGLTPVLVDVYPDTFDINIEAIEKAITPKTKAIVPVHLFGQCANMEAIMQLASKHKLYVIEDTAQAIGADFTFSNGETKKAGTIGTVGCTSFFPSKNLGCYGDGGAIYTNDDVLAAKLRMIANHGQSVQYVHDSIGVNSRLDSIQAAILGVKLKHLDAYAAARNKAADYYDKAFANHPKLKTPVRVKNSNHVFHQYTLQLKNVDRSALREFLSANGVPAMIYYPIPLHMQKAYTDARYKAGDFPVTEALCASVISLPMHTELTEDTLGYITSKVLAFINQ
jgi:dTDP-4-amino-4,6-dideoxygalactose transaminase